MYENKSVRKELVLSSQDISSIYCKFEQILVSFLSSSFFSVSFIEVVAVEVGYWSWSGGVGGFICCSIVLLKAEKSFLRSLGTALQFCLQFFVSQAS